MSRQPFPQLLTMSRDEAEAFVAGPDDVCISVNSPRTPESEWTRLSPNFRAVLRVAFDDCAGLGDPLPAGAVEITPEVAARIVAFAREHCHAHRLLVHCAAGVSRSVALAQALSVSLARRWYLPKWFRSEWRQARHVHNRAVFDAILSAVVASSPTSPERTP